MTSVSVAVPDQPATSLGFGKVLPDHPLAASSPLGQAGSWAPMKVQRVVVDDAAITVPSVADQVEGPPDRLGHRILGCALLQQLDSPRLPAHHAGTPTGLAPS